MSLALHFTSSNMLDIQLFRKDIDAVAQRLATRGFQLDVAAFQALEAERKQLQTQTEELQARRNSLSKQIGMAKGKGEDASALMAEVGGIADELKAGAERLDAIQVELNELLMGVPNLPDAVACEAYSHEVSSAGFWPGSGAIDYPAFYSYAYPEPPGYRTTKVRPIATSFNETLGEFILPYDAVRTASDPDQALLEFLQSTYDAAANAGKWDRGALECEPGQPRVVRQI